MSLSPLTPVQEGLLPIALQPDGQSISVGRLTGHGIVGEADHINQVSRKACTLELKDGKLYLQNVGAGLVRVVRDDALHSLARDARMQQLPGDRIELLIRIKEEPRPVRVIASWLVPTSDRKRSRAAGGRRCRFVKVGFAQLRGG